MRLREQAAKTLILCGCEIDSVRDSSLALTSATRQNPHAYRRAKTNGTSNSHRRSFGQRLPVVLAHRWTSHERRLRDLRKDRPNRLCILPARFETAPASRMTPGQRRLESVQGPCAG